MTRAAPPARYTPARCPPGHRGRIGILQPAPGVMLEHEWPRWLPHGMLFPVTRLHLPNASRSGYRQMALDVPAAARDLASAGCGVVAYACTIGSLCDGPEAEVHLLEDIATASGRPVISLADISCRALRAVGAHRIAILSPYSGETLRWVEDYMLARGFAIAGHIPTPVDIMTVGNLHPAEIAALACDGLAAMPDADALWIPCTAIQTLDGIATIEAISAIPVVTGSQALLWGALRTLDIADAMPGAGALFTLPARAAEPL